MEVLKPVVADERALQILEDVVFPVNFGKIFDTTGLWTRLDD